MSALEDDAREHDAGRARVPPRWMNEAHLIVEEVDAAAKDLAWEEMGFARRMELRRRARRQAGVVSDAERLERIGALATQTRERVAALLALVEKTMSNTPPTVTEELAQVQANLQKISAGVQALDAAIVSYQQQLASGQSTLSSADAATLSGLVSQSNALAAVAAQIPQPPAPPVPPATTPSGS